MRISFILCCFLLTLQTLFGQGTERTASITVSGHGKSKEEAEQTGLRSAIEQTFGAFISSKTEVFNDQQVSDQIVSVTNGNIKSFKIVNESQFPDGSWGVTLKVLVSVDKLTSFVESKGVAVEFKGNMFALNIRQQLLNEQAEIKAIQELVGLLHEPMQTVYDFEITSSDPVSMDKESKNWKIELKVIAKANKNMSFCANYFLKTLQSLSMSEEEVKSYLSLKKKVYEYGSWHNIECHLFLRNERSKVILDGLFNNKDYYTRIFTVQSDKTISGLDKIKGQFIWADLNHPWRFKFSKEGEIVTTFRYTDVRTLAEIEKITGYKVTPDGVQSLFKHGGYVVYEENGHGLVCAIEDQGNPKKDEAAAVCKKLDLNGYSDWRLPTIEELKLVYSKIGIAGIGNFRQPSYLSSNVDQKGCSLIQTFSWIYSGKIQTYCFSSNIGVRAVRTF